MVLFGDGEEPQAHNRVIAQGPGLLPRVGTPCPGPWGSGSQRAVLGCARGAELALHSHSPSSPSSQTISGRNQDGPPGNLPKAFSLVPLGKDPEKDEKCPIREGGGRVGPSPGALSSHKAPPRPRPRLCSPWALRRAGGACALSDPQGPLCIPGLQARRNFMETSGVESSPEGCPVVRP